MSIYVGNLSYSVTQDDLTKVFSEYGSVTRVQLPTDRETGRVRGFGFVGVYLKLIKLVHGKRKALVPVGVVGQEIMVATNVNTVS